MNFDKENTSTLDGEGDIDKDAFSKTTLNGKLSFTSTGEGGNIQSNIGGVAVSKNTKYTDENGNVAVIPKGFAISGFKDEQAIKD